MAVLEPWTHGPLRHHLRLHDSDASTRLVISFKPYSIQLPTGNPSTTIRNHPKRSETSVCKVPPSPTHMAILKPSRAFHRSELR